MEQTATAIALPVKQEKIPGLNNEAQQLVVCLGDAAPDSTEATTAEKAAGLMLGCIKGDIDDLEQERLELAQPIKQSLEEIEGPYKMAVSGFKSIKGLLDAALGSYKARLTAHRVALQQKAIDDYNRQKAEEDAKAAKAKAIADEAERKAKQARQDAAAAQSAEEKKRLLDEAAKAEKVAVKAEGKADEAVQRAATVEGPVVVAAKSGPVALGGGMKQGYRDTTEVYFTNGSPSDGDYYRDDPRFKPIADEFFVLDWKKIVARVKSGGVIEGIGSKTVPKPVSYGAKKNRA